MADKDAGGGGGTVAFFAAHDADGAAVCQEGAAISATATGFADVGDNVRRGHTLAVAAVEGDIRPPMLAAVFPVLAQAEDLQRAAEVGGAAVTLWGTAVGEFNRATEARNRLVESEKTPEERRQVYDRLLPAHRRDEAELERAAEDAARILRDPQSEQSIKTLWRAGLLPTSTRALFDHVDLPSGREQAMRRHLATLVRNGTLPADVLAMDPQELADYLEHHPDLATKVSKLDLDDLPDDVPGADLKEVDDPKAIRRILNHLDPADAATLALLYSKDLRNTNGVPFHLRTLGNNVAVTAARQRLLARLRAPLKTSSGPGDAQERRDELADRASMRKRLTLYDSILQNDRQLLLFKPDASHDDGQIAELHGHIDRDTKNLALMVPGAKADLNGLNELSKRADSFVDQSVRDDGGSLAAITWIGGDFPDDANIEAARPGYGQNMAEDLSAFGDEVRAETDSAADGAKVTAVGHSYGGTVVGLAERAGLDVDRVVHAGSAGMGNEVNGPEDLPETVRERDRYSVRAPDDPIDKTNSLGPLNPHGADPDDFPGTRQLPTGNYEDGSRLEGKPGHSGIFEPRSDAWRQMYGVMIGRQDSSSRDASGALP